MSERHPLLDGLGAGHGVVTASAGTGKTYFLECVVADLIQRGTPLDRILVVTFTHKAVAELKQRVRARILALLNEGGSDADMALLRKARRDLDRAAILTLHGFCQQVLQDEAFAAGRPLVQKVSASRPLRERAFLEALRKGLAGPGAETWERALQFKKGAKKLSAWICDLLPEMDRLEPGQSDLEALLNALSDAEAFRELEALEAHMSPKAVQKAFRGYLDRVMASLNQLPDVQALFQSSKEWSKSEGKWWGEFTTLEVSPAGERLRNAMKAAPSFPTEAILLRPLLEQTRGELERLKAFEGVLDFDDMIHLLRKAMEADPSLAEKVANRFEVGLLDEAQDTSEDQWSILWRIFGRDGRRLILVGDAKQAIYGFQGGDLPAFQAARETLLAHGATSQSLRANWRATQDLVTACNELLKLGDPGALVKEPWDPVAAFTEADLAQAQACSHPPVWDRPLPAVQVIPVPFHSKSDDALEAAAERLAEALKALKTSAPVLVKDGVGRPLSYSDCFVLVRKNHEAKLLGEVFRRQSVPFLQHKARGLYGSEAAQDLIALLRALSNPSRAQARTRALLTPFFGLTLDEAEAARELVEDHPICERFRTWTGLGSSGRAAALFDRILGESGVVARLLAAEPGQRRLADLLHLTELLQAESGPGDGPAEHLRRLERWNRLEDLPEDSEDDNRRLEQEGEAVRILTLHAAKGLEAPVVAFFGGLGSVQGAGRTFRRFHRKVEGRWVRRVWAAPKGGPANFELDAEEWGEERRLLYVGLTRAKGMLVLPFHNAREDEKRMGNSPFDEKGDPKGPYGLIQKRLGELRSSAPTWLAWGELAVMPPSPVVTASPLVLIPPPQLDVAGLRWGARPLRTESFTSLQRRAEYAQAEDGLDPEPDRPVTLPGGPPGGTATGVALHGMLETADFDSFEPEFRTWWSETRRLWSESHCAAAGLDVKWAEEAGRLAHAGLGTPLQLPDRGSVPFAALDPARTLRELEFLTASEGGRLTGSLDAIFEHQGRTYLLDWKSNRLENYGDAALTSCMEEDYALQVKVYTLAALRFLRIENEADYESRFGGVLYVFLRGLPEEGQWNQRPSWAETRAWSRELETILEGTHG